MRPFFRPSLGINLKIDWECWALSELPSSIL